MKKKILLLTVMLLIGLCANAVSWQPVNTNVPGVDLYIDMDSIRSISDNECLYAIRYTVAGKPEQVAYLKSDSKTNYLGIIQAGDYDEDKYRPNAVLAEPHVFMKPIKDGSFLGSVHGYALAASRGMVVANNSNEYNAVYTNDKPILRDDLMVAYNSANSRDFYSAAEFKDYVARTCKLLEQNWTPPATGRDTRAILIVTIGSDGSLLKYSFAEASGDTVTDRSIISAAEKTVPYPKFPEVAKNAYSLDFQFVFEHDLIKKSVVY